MLSPSAELTPRPRKWDAEITTARQHDTWLAFETVIHQSATLHARFEALRELVLEALGRQEKVILANHASSV